ncbi:hypothetical protein BaRGS_00034910 [Batillaria attramentaria]|uniref:Uncharacterized protein n=1 Tax=Batillaria attramentaria TaxID=370345 RepID=A0ABD0JFR6_9CAEN
MGSVHCFCRPASPTPAAVTFVVSRNKSGALPVICRLPSPVLARAIRGARARSRRFQGSRAAGEATNEVEDEFSALLIPGYWATASCSATTIPLPLGRSFAKGDQSRGLPTCLPPFTTPPLSPLLKESKISP